MVTPPAPQPPVPGSDFGPYRIDSQLAVSRAGVLYLATDQRLARPVALKVVVGNLAASTELVDRFQRQAATLAQLESPHVVQVFDHGVHDGLPFIATQYAGGGDLGGLLARLGPMPPPLAAQACSQVAEALRDAHRAGVVHRNLKPSNVLLRDDRLDRLHVLVCDFGVGPTEGSSVTEPASAPGAWDYLAPERLRGEAGSEPADVYALGCLLHQTVTGRPPFTGTDVEVAQAHLDAPVPQLDGTDDATQRLNQLLTRALAKDPTQRPTAAEVRHDLRAYAGILTTPPAPAATDAPVATAPPSPPVFESASIPQAPPYAGEPPPGSPGSPGSTGRKKVAILGAGALALLLVIGGGIAFAVTSGDDDKPEAGPTDTTDTPDTPDPTGSDSPGTGPVEPDTSGAVTGDLDGNGFGDLSLMTYDGLMTLPSDGTSLGEIVVRNNLSGVPAVMGDVDNDGALDVVRLSGEPPRFSALASTSGAPISPLSVPVDPAAITTLSYPFALGDVSADGNLDLVVHTRLSDTTAQVDVALGDGTGRFATTDPWFSGEVSEPEGGSIYVVDADGDGTGDLVRVTEGRETDGPQAMLLTSDGSGAFTPTGEATQVDAGNFAVGEVMSGDFDGDGDDEVAATRADARLVTVWSWNGSTFDQAAWYDDTDNFEPQPITSSDYAVSDVDGDGRDDIVVLGARSDEDFQDYVNTVLVSDGTSFAPDQSWRRTIDLMTDSTGLNPLDRFFFS